jgi:hypothetical protein
MKYKMQKKFYGAGVLDELLNQAEAFGGVSMFVDDKGQFWKLEKLITPIPEPEDEYELTQEELEETKREMRREFGLERNKPMDKPDDLKLKLKAQQ